MEKEPRQFLRCTIEIGPWLFPDERFIQVSIAGIIYQSIVDREDVRTDNELVDNKPVEGLLQVYEVESRGENRVHVLLPREVFNAGRRLLVPSDMVQTI